MSHSLATATDPGSDVGAAFCTSIQQLCTCVVKLRALAVSSTSWALLAWVAYTGPAMTHRKPMIATTISNSKRVNPRSSWSRPMVASRVVASL